MTKFQIGAQMYSLRDRCTNAEDMMQAMKDLKAIGYNLVQFSGHNSSITAEQLKNMLDVNGMECGSTHTPIQGLENDFEKTVAEHRMWGCNYPGVGAWQLDLQSPDTVRAYSKRISVIADKLAEQGMYLVYHNHAIEMRRFDCGQNCLEIMKENCSPNVKFELDLYWVQCGGGSPVEYLENFANRIDVVHFKEMNATYENTSIYAPIGKGNMNWPEILKVCDQTGVKYAFIEQDNAPDTNSMECMKASHDYLVSIGGRF